MTTQLFFASNFYFHSGSIFVSKESRFCQKLKFSYPYIFALWYFKLELFELTEVIVWNMNVYDIGLQRSRDYKIRVCGKTHFLFIKIRILSLFIPENKHQRKWVFVTNSNFLILISSQPVGLNLWYFKLKTIWSNIIYSLKYQMSTVTKIKELKIEFVTITT